MQTGDTTLGGGGKAFPETTLGFAGNADVETLCHRYWKPVYSWIRIARARTNDDAKDLTQEFWRGSTSLSTAGSGEGFEGG